MAVRGRTRRHSSTASPAGHRVAQRPRHRELHAPEVEEGDVDLQAVGDLAHAVVEHRVARDPQHAVLLAVPAQGEADHVAHDRAAQGRPVTARRGGDLDGRPPGRLQERGRPRLEAARPRSQPPGAGGRRHDDPRRGQERAAGRVEVVAVVVVAQQHRVDRRQIGGGDRRPGRLARPRAPAEPVGPARGVEGRVGQETPATGLDEDRRPADVRDPDVLHAPAWPSAQSSA